MNSKLLIISKRVQPGAEPDKFDRTVDRVDQFRNENRAILRLRQQAGRFADILDEKHQPRRTR